MSAFPTINSLYRPPGRFYRYVLPNLHEDEYQLFLCHFLGRHGGAWGLLFGFDIAIITGAGPFLTEHFNLNDLSLGWVFSSLLFACAVGSTVAGRLTDFYGRKKILLIVAALFAIISLGTGVAPAFAFFIAARFIGGVAVGGVSILSPLYVAEISPPSLRRPHGRPLPDVDCHRHPSFVCHQLSAA